MIDSFFYVYLLNSCPNKDWLLGFYWVTTQRLIKPLLTAFYFLSLDDMHHCKLSEAVSSPGLPFCSACLCIAELWSPFLRSVMRINTNPKIFPRCSIHIYTAILNFLFTWYVIFFHTFKVCFPAAPICTHIDDGRDPRLKCFEGKGDFTPHSWIFRFCKLCRVWWRGLPGKTSRVCQLWFSHGPSSSGPADTEVRAPLTMAAGARPSPPPAALTPSTLLLAGWDTPTSQRLMHPKLRKNKEVQSLREKEGTTEKDLFLQIQAHWGHATWAINFTDWIITKFNWKGIKLNYWIMLH